MSEHVSALFLCTLYEASTLTARAQLTNSVTNVMHQSLLHSFDPQQTTDYRRTNQFCSLTFPKIYLHTDEVTVKYIFVFLLFLKFIYFFFFLYWNQKHHSDLMSFIYIGWIIWHLYDNCKSIIPLYIIWLYVFTTIILYITIECCVYINKTVVIIQR